MSCIPNITRYSVSVRYVTVLVKEFHMLNSSSECVVIGIMSQALYKYGVLACFHFPGSHGRHSPQSLRQKVNRQTKGRPLFPQWPLRPQICCSSVCVLTCYEWRHQDSIFILLYVPSYSFTLSLMQLFSSFSLSQVVVPMRVGQVYVYDTGKNEQDEYDVPRHLPPTQDIYDVPPTRTQYNQQVKHHMALCALTSLCWVSYAL